MREIKRNGVRIDDSFAEAFRCAARRSSSPRPTGAGRGRPPSTMTGFATSVIGCGAEAGIDGESPARDAGRAPRRARAHLRHVDRPNCRSSSSTASANAC